jgi:biopolymer transport protein ExbB
VLELVKSGGWMMLPILLCSVAALAISAERIWTLRHNQIIPQGLLAKVWDLRKKNQLTPENIKLIKDASPMGRIIVAGLLNAKSGRDVMKESIEDVARHTVHDMERFLNTLGTIAAITPLLGLLGTVFGMIKVFSAIVVHGSGDTAVLAGGISQALITTAAGLMVAIPSLFFHRYLTRRIEELTVTMEAEAMKLMDAFYKERSVPSTSEPSKG